MAYGERRGFEGGVVPQAAEESGGPAGGHRKGLSRVGNQAEVSKGRFVNYSCNGLEKFGAGFGGVRLGGDPSGLTEESFDVCAPPDGFAGVAAPMSSPLEIRCVQLVPEEVNVVVINDGFVGNEEVVVEKLWRNREFRIERVILVRGGVIGVAIDVFPLLFPSFRMLSTFGIGARILLLVAGDFLLILVVVPAGSRVVLLNRLGSGWFNRGGPLLDEGFESLGHTVQGRAHAGF